jgi:hypothetical protein
MPLKPPDYDEIELTYVSGGAADGKLGTVIYKYESVEMGSVIMEYDSSGKLSRVTKSLSPSLGRRRRSGSNVRAY